MKYAPFLRFGPGIHPTIDRRALIETFPDLPVDVWNVTSASNLLGWETLREQYEVREAGAIPCDLFVWGTGQPPNPRMTRIGGIPWLPKRTPWPVIGDVVTTFLCQFNFNDSRDLLGQRVAGELPGDILLIFVAEEASLLYADENHLRFVWVSEAETDIVTAADVPSPTAGFEFVTAWGARYRTKDLPAQWEYVEHTFPEDFLGGNAWKLPVWWGTKIGGVPYHSQECLTEAPADYLCQLVSVQAGESRWPWVDHETPFEFDLATGRFEMYQRENSLMIGDMGELTFFLRDDGTVSASSACG